MKEMNIKEWAGRWKQALIHTNSSDDIREGVPIVVTSFHDSGSTGRQHLLLVTDK